MAQTTIVNEAVYQKIDAQTGEVLEMEQSIGTRTIYKQEPPYIKLYLQDILYLNDVPKSLTNVMYALLNYVTYADQENGMCIPLNGFIKQQIREKCGMDNPRTLNNALSKLVKGNILKRIGSGTYQLNPYFFGKGDWKDIANIRATWSYDIINGRTFQTAITYKEQAQNGQRTAQDGQGTAQDTQDTQDTQEPPEGPPEPLEEPEEPPADFEATSNADMMGESA